MAKKAAKKKKAAPTSPRPTVARQPSPESPALTKEIMERWHKSVAKAAGQISMTLSRRRRSPTFVDDLLELLAPVVEEMRTHQ